jgi:hypothetical protein
MLMDALAARVGRATLSLATHSGTKLALVLASFCFRVLSYSHSITGKLNLTSGMTCGFFEPCDNPPAKRAML